MVNARLASSKVASSSPEVVGQPSSMADKTLENMPILYK